ncbi:hypothetical protein G7Z17_g214 [Cylindrodendrum hubeiense]|uniref:Subtilisin n=1 Tax=Cylindrodendrum hubeiense TaxID=595255 RepID=A0A9P5HQ29_9HYPO|nr:hypothetical protein G7Z17_g214 [Cylindrodendrum hubeiense]
MRFILAAHILGPEEQQDVITTSADLERNAVVEVAVERVGSAPQMDFVAHPPLLSHLKRTRGEEGSSEVEAPSSEISSYAISTPGSESPTSELPEVPTSSTTSSSFFSGSSSTWSLGQDTSTRGTSSKHATETRGDASTGASSSFEGSEAPPTTSQASESTSAITPVNSGDQTATSNTDGTIATEISTPIVITGSDGQLSTQILPTVTGSSTKSGIGGIGSTIERTTLTNPDGQVTAVLPSSTLPVGTTGEGNPTLQTNASLPITTTNADGDVTTIFPPVSQPTGTDENSPISGGGTLASSSVSEIATTPIGIPTPITSTNADGQVITALPPSSSSTDEATEISHTKNTDATSLFLTVITNTDGQLTTVLLPEKTSSDSTTISEFVTTNADGQVSTVLSPEESSHETSVTASSVTTNLAGQVTSVMTSASGTILTDGQVTTIALSKTLSNITADVHSSTGVVSTTVPHNTDTSSSAFAEVTSTSIGVVTTLSDGQMTTIITSSGMEPITTVLPSTTTDTAEGGWIVPVTSSVDEPQASGTSTIIPCSMWFFSICINLGGFNIFGWQIVLPPGDYPPGPPPFISIPPNVGFTIEIKGTLPPWPSYTIGPDRIPTFPAKPTDGPDDGCETETAELCATMTSYGVSISSEETKTTTTQVLSTCGTVYGCKVEDASTTQTTTSTRTATATPISHVIYPMSGRNESQVAEIQTILNGLVDDASEIYLSDTVTFGINFWRLPLTLDQADKLREHSSVASVMEACDNDNYPCWDPTIELVFQEDAPTQLSYVSWPNLEPRVPLSSLNGRYYFDDSSGQDIDVWILDTGASAAHPEFDLIRDRLDWIIKVKDFDGVERQDDSRQDLDQQMARACHGTSMLSLVAGKTLGVVKHINPHIARLPRLQRNGGGIFRPDDFIETLSGINDRITADPSGDSTGILLLAHYFQRSFFYRLRGDKSKRVLDLPVDAIDESFGFEYRLYDLLQDITDKGVLVITGSGNVAGSTIDGWPQNYGKTNAVSSLPELIVVAAVSSGDPNDVLHTEGYGTTDYANGLPHFYAPGFRMEVADGNTQNWGDEQFLYRQATGTSDSAAMTAGLAAYFLRLAKLEKLKDKDGKTVPATASAIRAYIIDKTWSRGKVNIAGQIIDRDAIWNGADLAQPACQWDPNPLSNQRREEDSTSGAVCELPLASSSTISSQTSTASETSTASKKSTASETSTASKKSTASHTTTASKKTTASEAESSTMAMPTLSNAPVGTISTHSGSSCAETATATRCAMGPGGQIACVENPTCASWVSTETTTSEEPEPTKTETPETPLESKDVVCENEDDFPGHGDIDSTYQYGFAQSFCTPDPGDDKTTSIGPGDDPVEDVRSDGGGIHYSYSVSWIDGCVTEVDTQSMQWPIGLDVASCRDLLVAAYSDCINGGVGGYIDAGCLRYHFIGGKG